MKKVTAGTQTGLGGEYAGDTSGAGGPLHVPRQSEPVVESCPPVPQVSDSSRRPVEVSIGTVSGIPIRNIWLLMLYASRLFRQIDHNDRCRIEENPDEIADVVAAILVRAVERRLRRNLSFHFCQRDDRLRRVRGRIDMLETERHQLLSRGQVACRFDELTINTPRNRYVRAALTKMAGVVTGANPELARRCRAGAASLERIGVIGGKPGKVDGPVDQFGRHDFDDRLMVSAAQLAFELALPTEQSGIHWMPSPDRDEIWMRRLFEAAVAGFYDFTLPRPEWSVRAQTNILWPVDSATDGMRAILPGMRTDMVLDNHSRGQRFVIDTKFTSIIKPGYYGKDRLSSAYVYQIYAYLRSQEGRGDPMSDTATGIMLHPSVGHSINESATIQGHKVQFATVDLAGPANHFRSQLLDLVG